MLLVWLWDKISSSLGWLLNRCDWEWLRIPTSTRRVLGLTTDMHYHTQQYFWLHRADSEFCTTSFWTYCICTFIASFTLSLIFVLTDVVEFYLNKFLQKLGVHLRNWGRLRRTTKNLKVETDKMTRQNKDWLLQFNSQDPLCGKRTNYHKCLLTCTSTLWDPYIHMLFALNKNKGYKTEKSLKPV